MASGLGTGARAVLGRAWPTGKSRAAARKEPCWLNSRARSMLATGALCGLNRREGGNSHGLSFGLEHSAFPDASPNVRPLVWVALATCRIGVRPVAGAAVLIDLQGVAWLAARVAGRTPGGTVTSIGPLDVFAWNWPPAPTPSGTVTVSMAARCVSQVREDHT